MLAVDPAAQGAGAGTALARLCEERAREHGAAGMALSSLATMAARPPGLRAARLHPRARRATGRRCPVSTCSRSARSF